MDQDQELWQKIKTARDYLFTQTDFLNRYNSSGLAIAHNEAHPVDGADPRCAQLAMTTVTSNTNSNSSGDYGDCDQDDCIHDDQNQISSAARDFSFPSVVVTAPSTGSSELSHHNLPSKFLSQGTQTEEKDTTVKTYSRGTQTPWSWAVASKDTGEETSSEPFSSPVTVVPAASPSSTKRDLSSQKAPQKSSDKTTLDQKNSGSEKAKHSATTKETTSRPINKMSTTTDSSDVVVLRDKFTENAPQWDTGARVPGESDQASWSNQQCSYASPKRELTDSDDLGLEGVDVNTGRASAGVGPSQGILGSAKKDAKRDEPMTPAEELEMLKKQILVNAHMKRYHNFDTHSINPKYLAKARDGPGTDPNSEVYREFMQSAIPHGVSSSVDAGAGAQNANDQYKVLKGEELAEQHDSMLLSYSESRRIYPVVEDGQLVLSSEPTPLVQYYIGTIGREFGLGVSEDDLKETDQAAEINWGDPFYADWEFRPRVCSNFPAFRDWFRRWLDTALQVCCNTDVYHPAFFDGIAHSNGIKSFYLPDVEHPPTRLDLSHEETRLHAHETAEGYCHNWARHVEQEKKEKKAQKALAKAQAKEHAAHLESIKKRPVVTPPQAPKKPYYYLRPVEIDDVSELREIMNWAIQNSTLPLSVSLLEADHVREHIETAKREMLPFLVAAERRPVHCRREEGDGQSRGLLGYAFATDTAGDRTAARFTAELELFVLPGHRERGIGRCLMDKLMEVCDPTYQIKGGYFFDASWEDRPGYSAGGRRSLARLLFIVSVPDDERAKHQWLLEWFERGFGFEQQGLLKGIRVKFNKFYMVRRVGCVDDSTFGRN